MRAYKERIFSDHTKKTDNAPEIFVALLRRKVVKPMVEEKAKLLLSQAGWEFPSEGERNAFISWAANAGKLRFLEELKGVYESSTKLAKALEDKLLNDATPTAQDIVDVFKEFYPTCHDFMVLDKHNHGEYGPDDQSAAVNRAVSVAMSRLAVRLGGDAMKRLAAAFGSAETCALYCGAAAGTNAPFQPEDAASRTGNFYFFTVFMDVFYQRLPEKFDAPLAKPEIRGGLPLAAVSTDTRNLMRQINEAQTAAVDTVPFDPNAAVRGVRRLERMASPANPDAMPQDKAVNQTTLEGYLFKSADSLDYSRIADLDPKRFPFLRESIVTRDGLVVAADESLRRQLMKEALLLSKRTGYGTARGNEVKQFQIQLAQLSASRAPENEMQAVQDLQKEITDDIHAKEIEQTNTLSDAQIIDLVENTIRDNPDDFPLLSKYYLNADA